MKTTSALLAHFVALVAIAASGCSAPRASQLNTGPAPLNPAITGRIAVVPSAYPHVVGFDRRTTGEKVRGEAIEYIPGWTRESAEGIAVSAAASHPIMLMLLAVPATGAVVGMTVGAASGVARSNSSADVELAEASIVRTRLAEGLQTRIAEELARTQHDARTSFSFVQNAKAKDPGADRPEVLLELEVLSLHLVNESSWSPRLTLAASAQARFKRASDGVPLDWFVVHYRSPGRLRLREWSADSGQPMRDELERCAHELATKVTAKLTENSGAKRSQLLPPSTMFTTNPRPR